MRHSQTGKHTRHFHTQSQKFVLAFWILFALLGTSARASELKPETAAAFDRYIAATEARMGEDVRLNQFLVVDRLPDLQRKEAYNQLQSGQAYIEELHTKQEDRPIHIPSGLIHHWVGVMFIPKGTLSETLAVLNDYNNEPEIYKPEIRRAKLIEQKGNESKIYLQFYSKSIVTVVLDAYFDVVEHTSWKCTRLKAHPAPRALWRWKIPAIQTNTSARTGTIMDTCGASTATGESKKRTGAYTFKTNRSH